MSKRGYEEWAETSEICGKRCCMVAQCGPTRMTVARVWAPKLTPNSDQDTVSALKISLITYTLAPHDPFANRPFPSCSPTATLIKWLNKSGGRAADGAAAGRVRRSYGRVALPRGFPDDLCIMKAHVGYELSLKL